MNPDKQELPQQDKTIKESKNSRGKSIQQTSAPESNELKLLRESFERIHTGSDSLQYEYDLTKEAKNLGMSVDEYRRLYTQRSSDFLANFLGRSTWLWTGFREKKLWDYLQLLVVPLLLAGGAFYLQDQAKRRETDQSTKRYEHEQSLTANRHIQEQQLAEDRTKQETLNKYFDAMTTLLFEHKLKTGGSRSAAWSVAKARTVTTLRELDEQRNSQMLGFLREAGLIGSDSKSDLTFNGVILTNAKLKGANLYKVNLSGSKLTGVDFQEAYLGGANLRGATLDNVDLANVRLIGADLEGANLQTAKLQGADFTGANLKNADLENADLSAEEGIKLISADLQGANLRNANLRGANLTSANLANANLMNADLSDVTSSDYSKAKLCQTKMPDGEMSDRDCPPSGGGGGVPGGGVVKVTTDGSPLSIHSGPGKQYSVVGKFKNGTKVSTYGFSNGWYRVSEGWISSTYLDSVEEHEYIVVTAGVPLSVYSDPGTTYPIVDTLSNGETVRAERQKGDQWARLGKKRWVLAKYLHQLD